MYSVKGKKIGNNTKSIILYLPPNGTAGFARSFVSGCNLLPSPPAKIITNASSIDMLEPHYLLIYTNTYYNMNTEYTIIQNDEKFLLTVCNKFVT